MIANENDLSFVLKFRNEADKALKQAQGQFKDTGESINDADKRAKNMARTLKVLAGALVTFFFGFRQIKGSLDAFSEAEVQMANIATLLSGDSTAAVEKLNTTIQKMASQTGTSLKDLRDATYQIVSAFGEAADAAGILEVANQLAIGGLATTEESVRALSAVTKAYGDTTIGAVAHASDLLITTVRLGQTTLPELAHSMGVVAPNANALKVSFDEVSAVFATLTGVTGDTNIVATQMRAIMTSLLKPVGELEKLMGKLHITTSELHQRIADNGLIATLQWLKQVGEENGVEFTKLIQQAESLGAVLSLTGANAQDFANKFGEVKQSDGARFKAFLIQMDTLDRSMKRISQGWQAFKEQIGAALAPSIKKFADALASINTAFYNLNEQSRTGIAKMIAFGLATVTAASALVLMAPGLAATYTGFTKLGGSLTKLFKIMIGPALSHPILAVSVLAIAAAMKYFGVSFSDVADYVWKTAQKIGIVFTSIWTPLWEGMKEVVADTIDKIKEYWNNMVNFFGRFKNLWGVFWDAVDPSGVLTGAADKLKEAAAKEKERIHRSIMESLNELMGPKGIAEMMAKLDAVDQGKSVSEALLGMLDNGAGAAVDALGNAVGIEHLSELLAKFREKAITEFNNIQANAGSLAGGGSVDVKTETDTDEAEFKWKTLQERIADAKIEVRKTILQLRTEFSDLGKDLSTVLSDYFTDLRDAFADFITTGKLKFSDLIDNMLQNLAKLASNQFMSALLGLITGAVGQGAAGFFGGTPTPAVQTSTSTSVIPSPVIFNPNLTPQASLFGGATGGGGSGVTVNVINNASGTQARQESRQDASGGMHIDVIIESIEKKMGENIRSGTGLARDLEGQYGLDRARGGQS